MAARRSLLALAIALALAACSRAFDGRQRNAVVRSLVWVSAGRVSGDPRGSRVAALRRTSQRVNSVLPWWGLGTHRAPKPTMGARVGLLGLLAAAAVMVGCGAASSGEATDETPQAIVRSTTFVVDARPGEDVAVEADRLVFRRAGHEDLLARRAGEVVVCGAGEGFLRRVLGLHEDGDTIVVDTAQASLDDALEQGRVRARVLADEAGGLAPRGLTSGTVKLAVPPTHVPLGEHGSFDVVRGELDYTPELDVDLLVRRGAVERLKVVAGGSATASMRVRFDVHKKIGSTTGLWIRLDGPGTVVASLPAVHAVVWVGVVPVVVAVRVQLLLGHAFEIGGDASGELELELGAALRAGLSRENGEWQPIGASSFQLAPHGAVQSTAHAIAGDVTLTARVAVSFYEVAGPYVGIQAYAGIGHEHTAAGDDWFGQLGVRGVAGVQAGLFGNAVAGYQVDAFDRRVKVALTSR